MKQSKQQHKHQANQADPHIYTTLHPLCSLMQQAILSALPNRDPSSSPILHTNSSSICPQSAVLSPSPSPPELLPSIPDRGWQSKRRPSFARQLVDRQSTLLAVTERGQPHRVPRSLGDGLAQANPSGGTAEREGGEKRQTLWAAR